MSEAMIWFDHTAHVTGGKPSDVIYMELYEILHLVLC